jgi:hypothetical protein
MFPPRAPFFSPLDRFDAGVPRPHMSGAAAL